MKKNRFKRDFDYYIDEYMYNCRSRKLRPKTMISYEQSLRLFERWCLEEIEITEPGRYWKLPSATTFAAYRSGGNTLSTPQRIAPSPTIPHGGGTSLRLSAQLPSTTISEI